MVPLVRAEHATVDMQSQFVDSFTTLRLALRAHFTWDEPITLAVTSLLPKEGKTLVAANLSLNFAQAGFQTLLLDGDHRGSSASALFAIPTSPGLAELEHGETTVDAVVRSTSYDRLCVLPYGRGLRPASTKEKRDPDSLLQELHGRFDVIIMDCPWWGTSQQDDALVTRMSGFVIVRRVVDSDRFHQLDAGVPPQGPMRCLGMILNGIDLAKP